METYVWWQTLLTGVIAVATVAYVVGTFLLWRATRDAVRVAGRSSNWELARSFAPGPSEVPPPTSSPAERP